MKLELIGVIHSTLYLTIKIILWENDVNERIQGGENVDPDIVRIDRLRALS